MVPPVTRESVAKAKAETQRDRDEIERQTGIRVTDDPMNPFGAVVTRRINWYRQVAREDRRHE